MLQKIPDTLKAVPLAQENDLYNPTHVYNHMIAAGYSDALEDLLDFSIARAKSLFPLVTDYTVPLIASFYLKELNIAYSAWDKNSEHYKYIFGTDLAYLIHKHEELDTTKVDLSNTLNSYFYDLGFKTSTRYRATALKAFIDKGHSRAYSIINYVTLEARSASVVDTEIKRPRVSVVDTEIKRPSATEVSVKKIKRPSATALWANNPWR
jgi:hypothetical protein